MMLRPLWTWQRWMAGATPKVLRIALLSAFAPSTMNSRGSVGSSPLARRLSSKAWTTTVFSVAPSTTARTCLSPLPSTLDRRHQDMVADMQTVDLDDQQVELAERSEASQAFIFLRDSFPQSAGKRFRLRGAVATRFRQVAPRADGPRGGTCRSRHCSGPSG